MRLVPTDLQGRSSRPSIPANAYNPSHPPAPFVHGGSIE